MRKNKKYSEELKKAAVKSYLAGEGGVDKLKDNRGRTKPIEETTEIEKLKAEMKILESSKEKTAHRHPSDRQSSFIYPASPISMSVKSISQFPYAMAE